MRAKTRAARAPSKAPYLSACCTLAATAFLWAASGPAPALPSTRWVHFAGGTPATAPEMYTRPAREPDGSGHAGGLNEDFVALTLRNSNGASSDRAGPGESFAQSAQFTVQLRFDADSDLTWPDDYRVFEDVGTDAAPHRIELLPEGGVFTKTVPALGNGGGDVVRSRVYVQFQEDEVSEGLGALILRIVGVTTTGPGRVELGWNNRVRWLVEDDDANATLATLPAGWSPSKGGQ